MRSLSLSFSYSLSLSHCLSLILLAFSSSSCQRSTSVNGVWRESTDYVEAQDTSSINRALYELNLGQYGDRVAGVSIRYQKPEDESLASFDQADRCNCSFVVQGLIEELEGSAERQLLFVANGLTFSLYTPMILPSPTTNEPVTIPCPKLPQECQRIFDLEQVDGGEALEGYTWCLESPDDTRRPLRFEAIKGIPENVCEEE